MPIIIAAIMWVVRTIFAEALMRFLSTWTIYLTLEWVSAHIFGVMPEWFSVTKLLGFFTNVFDTLSSAGGDGLLANMWYMFNLMSIPFGFATVFNAYFTRYIVSLAVKK